MNTFWANIFRNRQKEPEKVRNILKKLPVFEDLNNRDLNAIERILHQREYREDEAIFLQGDPGLGMYIVESGTVAIVCEPDKHVLAELHNGEFFGEIALLDESPRTATAIAKTECRMLCFFQPDLFDLIDRNPRLGVKVLFRLARTISERLRKTNEQLYASKDSCRI